ncbi:MULTISPECIES: chaperone modulator CbpM [unclassified Frankia]|uniref:chaperone modulator CbpM n=1 Tax=unclassified Frankia TaxID=2632575 RepID=UPI002AD40B76|nr:MULTISPECIES: chaperone modulator CbpM [unclassified Frankia]
MNAHPRPERRPAAPETVRVGYPLARRSQRLTVDALARRAGLHPDLVRRFVALSLLDATRDARGQLWFTTDALVTLGRIQRLRAGLSLNYAAVGLVLDLLDRVETLERELRGHPPTSRPG